MLMSSEVPDTFGLSQAKCFTLLMAFIEVQSWYQSSNVPQGRKVKNLILREGKNYIVLLTEKHFMKLGNRSVFFSVEVMKDACELSGLLDCLYSCWRRCNS